MPRQAQALTEGIEEYLEAIWRVAGEGQAATKALAEHLGVAPASVSGMLKRLAALGLVEYRPYEKVSLSKTGKQQAAGIIRRHRLSERLLTDCLGLPWEKAHEQACKFEHLITGDIETALVSRLGDTQTCPHGHPMDTSLPDETVTLSQIEPPALVEVKAITDESSDLLSYLAKVGIVPGARLQVTGKEPVSDGPLLIEVQGQAHAVSQSVAEKIKVVR